MTCVAFFYNILLNLVLIILHLHFLAFLCHYSLFSSVVLLCYFS